MDFEIVIEADLFFRRMDVDVQLLRRDRKKQERDRKPAVKQLLLISLIQSLFQDFTGYDPAVDAEDLPAPGACRRRWRGHEPFDDKIPAGAFHRQKITSCITAVNADDGVEDIAFPASGENLFFTVDQGKTHISVCQCDPRYHVDDPAGFPIIRREEFLTCRNVVKQILNGHRRSFRAADPLVCQDLTSFCHDPAPHFRISRFADQFHPCHSTDACQCFPAKAQGADGVQIPDAADLAGGMT